MTAMFKRPDSFAGLSAGTATGIFLFLIYCVFILHQFL